MTSEFMQELQLREDYLRRVISQIEQTLDSFPEGSLRYTKHGKRVLYYHRTNPKDTSGKYIRQEDEDLASALAQKDYNRRVLSSAVRELNAIITFRKRLPCRDIGEIYDKLNPPRQQLITPIAISDRLYARQWESLAYTGRSLPGQKTDYLTERGEYVKSQSQLLIANQLLRMGIPYRYEFPCLLRGIGTIYPDFTVLHVKKRQELYWEHLSIMDDPDYILRSLNLIKSYQHNGIVPGKNLIITHEMTAQPLDTSYIENTIKNYLL